MLLRPHLALAIALGVGLFIPAGRAEAQFLGTGNDPFSLYFGYYLPHQAYIAAQPTPMDTLNRITAERQFNAATDRAGLYDPISPYGTEEVDPLAPYSPSRKGERLARPHVFASSTTNARGSGPALYYTRTARYYPSIRVGQGPNKNLGVVRRQGGGGFGGFSGGMGGTGGYSGPR